jgi:hypothetical protein
VETVKLILFILLVVVITGLPQLIGFGLYAVLKRRRRLWAVLLAILSPAAVFFVICYVFIRYVESKFVPSEYSMIDGFVLVVLYAYLAAGTILNLLVSIVIQLVLRRKHRRQASSPNSFDYRVSSRASGKTPQNRSKERRRGTSEY